MTGTYLQRVRSPSQRGQGMTEYIIIVALIAVAAIGVNQLFGQTIREQMAGIAAEVSGHDATTNTGNAKTAAEAAATAAAKSKGLATYDNSDTIGK
jgi:Flp pilus assembly pilin Flp